MISSITVVQNFSPKMNSNSSIFFKGFLAESSIFKHEQTIQDNLEAISDIEAENDRSGLRMLKQCM